MSVCGLEPVNRLLPNLRFADEVRAYGAIYGFIRRVSESGTMTDIPPLLLYGPCASGKSRLSYAIRRAIGLSDHDPIQGGFPRSHSESFRRVVFGLRNKGVRAVVLRDFWFTDIPGIEKVAYDLRIRRSGLIIETSDLWLVAWFMSSDVGVDGVCLCDKCLDANKGGA